MIRRLLLIALLLAGGVLLYRHLGDPLRTALPFGTADLATVQAELASLPADERALVESYVRRSRGDVLPAQLADPDAPLTARTFGEAIALERAWQQKLGVEKARAAQLSAEREAKLAPLREVAQASVLGAELSAERSSGRPAFVVRIRVSNLGGERILAVRGSLKARDREAVLPMDLCWIDLGSPQAIEPGGHLDIECGGSRGDRLQQKAFIDDEGERFRIEWEPRSLTLESGRELDSGL